MLKLGEIDYLFLFRTIYLIKCWKCPNIKEAKTVAATKSGVVYAMADPVIN